jgi:hypothetical protein
VRNTFIALLVVNIVYLAWSHWVDEPQPPPVNEALSRLPRLKLLSELPPEQRPGGAPSAPPPAATAPKLPLPSAPQPATSPQPPTAGAPLASQVAVTPGALAAHIAVTPAAAGTAH